MVVHRDSQRLLGVLADAPGQATAWLGGFGNGDRGFCRFPGASSCRAPVRGIAVVANVNPGPAMSFLTSAWDLPQKLQSVSWVGWAIEPILSCPPGS
jgi:hypothetical protein